MKYTVGIDLGGTNIAAGLVDENYTVLSKMSVPTRAPRPAAEIVADMAALAAALADQCGVTPSAIGVGAPGIISGGVIRAASNLQFTDVPLAAMMEEATHLPCRLGNDANAAALGENVAGAARGADSFVMITLGTGVGGGIIDHGQIVEGFNGAGAEIGHFTLYPHGRRCGCGKEGCYEAYCSATALIADTVAAMKKHPESKMWEIACGSTENVNGKTAFDGMRAGDATAKAVVDQYIADLGLGISSILTLLQPEVLAIGGGISREGETLLAPLREIVYPNAYFDSVTPRTRLVAATLRGDAGIVGAAALGFSAIR